MLGSDGGSGSEFESNVSRDNFPSGIKPCSKLLYSHCASSRRLKQVDVLDSAEE